MFKSFLGLIEDTAKIVTAPVEVAIDLTRTITKPVGDAAKELSEAAKELLDTDNIKD